MKMNFNISEGTKKLLYCLVGVFIILVAFLFGFQNFYEKNTQLRQQEIVLKEELKRLEEIQLNQEEYETETLENESKLKTYYAEFPAMIQVKDQVLYAAELEKKYDSLFISNLSMMDPEYITGTEGDAMALYRVETGLDCVINYEQLKDFLINSTKDGTRKAINEIVLVTDTDTGLLNGQISMNLYYMTGTKQTYQPEKIEDVSIGTNNIFGKSDVPVEPNNTEQDSTESNNAEQNSTESNNVEQE